MTDTTEPLNAAEAKDTPLHPASAAPGAAPGKVLTPAAIRALEEAEARRQAEAKKKKEKKDAKEIDGRDGPDPVRYGDWELKGTAIDFS
ncbi:MAG: DUF1674 domain-containing protein [Alphaproteobacteria bacterium]